MKGKWCVYSVHVYIVYILYYIYIYIYIPKFGTLQVCIMSCLYCIMFVAYIIIWTLRLWSRRAGYISEHFELLWTSSILYRMYEKCILQACTTTENNVMLASCEMKKVNTSMIDSRHIDSIDHSNSKVSLSFLKYQFSILLPLNSCNCSQFQSSIMTKL